MMWIRLAIMKKRRSSRIFQQHFSELVRISLALLLIFSAEERQILGPTLPGTQWVNKFFPRLQSARCMKPTIAINLFKKLRMTGDVGLYSLVLKYS
jgi:hypothetical protein